MKNELKCLILIILGGIIGVVVIVYVLPYQLFINDKIEEIPQYNCYILDSQLEKWKNDSTIFKALQNEYVNKECYKR